MKIDEANRNIEYDFNAISPYEYEMELKFIMENKFFLALLKKSANLIATFKREKKDYSKINQVEELEIPLKYLNLVKTLSGKAFRIVEDEIRKDNISILDYDVKKAILKRDGEYWFLFLNLSGAYADKR